MGATAAVHVIIKRSQGVGRVLGEAQAADDIGAAMASRLDHLLHQRRSVADDVEDGARARREALTGRRLRQHVSQRVGQRRSDGAVVVLELEVIGTVDLAEPRGVGRAARVLQQPGVEQVALVLPDDAELVGNAQGDEGGAS